MGKRKNALNALSASDEEFLWNSGQLGKHSAQALVNVNFKNVTEHLGLRGRQEHHTMNVEDFVIISSTEGGTKYVAFKEGPAKIRQGGLRIVHRAAEPKMFATRGDRCLVMLFEELLERRPPEMKKSGPFYLQTIPNPKSNVWFSRQRNRGADEEHGCQVWFNCSYREKKSQITAGEKLVFKNFDLQEF